VRVARGGRAVNLVFFDGRLVFSLEAPWNPHRN
jgi:hypothetical protein